MGINGSQQLLWNAKGLTLIYLNTLLSTKFADEQIRVDVDCNWLAYIVGQGKHTKEIVSATAKFLVCLAQTGGFIVTPVLDGDTRHHSK